MTDAPRGYLYELSLVETEIRATGLDAAHRVARRLSTALRDAMEADPEIITVTSGPFVREASSPKNFASKETA